MRTTLFNCLMKNIWELFWINVPYLMATFQLIRENANTPQPQIFIAIRSLHDRDGNNVDFFVPISSYPLWDRFEI